MTNTGDEPLRDVEAKAFVRAPLSSDDDEGIIPALAPGETKTIVIGLATGSNALEKSYPVSVDFQYELPDGDTRVSSTYQVPVTVEQQEDGGFPFLPVVLGAAAVVAVGLFAWFRRDGGD